MARIVVDTSAILSVLLHEESRPALIRASARHELVAPGSVPWEVGNALIAGTRKRRITAGQAQRAWDGFEAIPLELAAVDVPRALALAVEAGIYAYDAYVLQTAASLGLSLLTLDAGMTRIANQHRIALVEWTS